MMGSLFAMSVAALLVVGAQFWYIIVHIIIIIIIIMYFREGITLGDQAPAMHLCQYKQTKQ